MIRINHGFEIPERNSTMREKILTLRIISDIGYNAYLEGKTVMDNPYKDDDNNKEEKEKYSAWLGGFCRDQKL